MIIAFMLCVKKRDHYLLGSGLLGLSYQNIPVYYQDVSVPSLEFYKMVSIKRKNNVLYNFVNYPGHRQIPGLAVGYRTDLKGNVTRENGVPVKVVRMDEFGDWLEVVIEDWIGGIKINQVGIVNRAVLVSVTARNSIFHRHPTQITTTHPLTALKTYFLDNDCKNVHPKNTILMGLPLDSYYKLGWRYIYGFGRYIINEDGEIYNIKTETKVATKTLRSGYISCGLMEDIKTTKGGQKCALVHRLLLISWKEYPIEVCDLVVRHLDNVPHNNKLANLCLGTQKENIADAVVAGNWPGRVVEVRDIRTGEISTFRSIKTAAKELNLPNNTVKGRCKSKGKLLWEGKQWRFAKGNDPWPISPKISKFSGSYFIKYKNSPPTKVNCLHKAAKKISCRGSTLSKVLQQQDVCIKGDYIIWRDFRE